MNHEEWNHCVGFPLIPGWLSGALPLESSSRILSSVMRNCRARCSAPIVSVTDGWNDIRMNDLQMEEHFQFQLRFTLRLFCVMACIPFFFTTSFVLSTHTADDAVLIHWHLYRASPTLAKV